MPKKQNSLFLYFDQKPSLARYGRVEHGGLKSKNVRKNERPLSTKRPIHLVLKSSKAQGHLSFLSFKNRSFIEKIISQKAQKFGIKIQDFANVGNHLHLKLKIKSRAAFQKFLKSISSLIARHVTKAKKGNPFGKFWEGLAYTRVLTSKKEELYLKGYIEANRKEAAHSKAKREAYLTEFRSWVKNRYLTPLDPALNNDLNSSKDKVTFTRDDFNNNLKNDSRSDLKNDLKNDPMREFKNKLKNNSMSDFKNSFKKDPISDPKNNLKDSPISDPKNNFKNSPISDPKNNFKNSPMSDLKNGSTQIRQRVRPQTHTPSPLILGLSDPLPLFSSWGSKISNL